MSSGPGGGEGGGGWRPTTVPDIRISKAYHRGTCGAEAGPSKDDLGFDNRPDNVNYGEPGSSSTKVISPVPEASSTVIVGNVGSPMDSSFQALCNQVIGEGVDTSTAGGGGDQLKTLTFFAASPSPSSSVSLGEGQDQHVRVATPAQTSAVILENPGGFSVPGVTTFLGYPGWVPPSASEHVPDEPPKFHATWIKVTDGPAIGSVVPEPRHGHRAVSCGNLMIVFGGGPCKEDNWGKVHVLDTSKNLWFQPQLSGDIPCERAVFGMAVDGSRILIHGGFMGDSIFGDDLYQLNIKTWEWSKLNPSGPLPRGRLGHSFTIVWDKIYVFGGLANDEKGQGLHYPILMNDMHILHVRLNNEEGVWTQPATFGTPPSHRESHTAVAYTSSFGCFKKLVIYGGAGLNGSRLGDVNIFNLGSNTWSKPRLRGVPPIPMSLHSATMVGDKMYVFGGMSSSMEDVDGEVREMRFCSKSFSYFDVETLTWEHPDHIEGLVTGAPPPPRASHSAVLIGNKIYIFSGGDCMNQIGGRVVCFPDLWKVEVPAPVTVKDQAGDSDSESKWVTIEWNPMSTVDDDGNILQHDKVVDIQAKSSLPSGSQIVEDLEQSQIISTTGPDHSRPKALTPPQKANYCPLTSAPITPATPNTTSPASSPPSQEPLVKEIPSEPKPAPEASSSAASLLPPPPPPISVTYVPIYRASPSGILPQGQSQASSSHTRRKWRWLQDLPTQSSVADPLDFNFVCEGQRPSQATPSIPPDMSGISMLAEAAAMHESQSLPLLLSPADLVEQLQIGTGLPDKYFDDKIMGPSIRSQAPEYTATQLFQGAHIQDLKRANLDFRAFLTENGNILPLRVPASPPTTPSSTQGMGTQTGNDTVRETVIKFAGPRAQPGDGQHVPTTSADSQDQDQVEASEPADHRLHAPGGSEELVDEDGWVRIWP